MSTAKHDVQSLLAKLPDDCTLEDIQYHLYVAGKVQRGIEPAEQEGELSQEEVEQRLNCLRSSQRATTSRESKIPGNVEKFYL